MPINIPIRYDIKKYLPIYERIRALIDNDESKYGNDTFCLKFPNECENARAVRSDLLKRSFKNISGDLVGATKDAIFHEGIRLEFTGLDKNPLYEWSKDVTLGRDNTDLLQFTQDYTIYDLRAYGHVWTILDKPDYNASNFEDELKNGAPYITNIWPGDVVNYELIDGRLKWFAYQCNYFPPWTDPLSPPTTTTGDGKEIRIWTDSQFIVTDGVNVINKFNHNFGIVPVVYQSFMLPTDHSSILGQSPFFMSSNMIIMANNIMSVADMELLKHGNSLLLMHDEAISPANQEIDERGNTKTKIVDRTGYNKLVWSGEHPPEYLIKDLGSIDKAKDQANFYFSAAIENERSLQSIFHKRDTVRESGETKEYDAEPARAALRATAQDLESWCKKVLNMAAILLNRQNLVNSFKCEFPERYILSERATEKFDKIKSAIDANYPSITGRKEMYKALTPDIAHDSEVRTKINQEIDAAEIDLRTPDQIDAEIKKELQEDQDFEKSMEGMSEEEKGMARQKRKEETMK